MCSVTKYVGWIRLKPKWPGGSRHWKAVTQPLPEIECLQALAAYRAGKLSDGGKVALPEGEKPTLDREAA
jgi:hypothetical protein